jgi:hypothetical protein
MLYQRKQIKELYDLKHRHDNNDQFVDYEKQILDSSTSPYMYKNDMMNSFLKKIQPLLSLLFDQMNVVKNWRNYIVDKDYYQHNG